MPVIHICDGPNCEKVRPQHNEEGFYDWIHVEANEDDDYGEYCSWTCLAAHAMQKAIERENIKIE